jgi:hypothetical protein
VRRDRVLKHRRHYNEMLKILSRIRVGSARFGQPGGALRDRRIDFHGCGPHVWKPRFQNGGVDARRSGSRKRDALKRILRKFPAHDTPSPSDNAAAVPCGLRDRRCKRGIGGRRQLAQVDCNRSGGGARETDARFAALSADDRKPGALPPFTCGIKVRRRDENAFDADDVHRQNP